MTWRPSLFPGNDAPVRDLRHEMISQTEAFLTWAMAEDRSLPRIPRREVRRGGFTALLRDPGVRDMVNEWWLRILGSGDLDA